MTQGIGAIGAATAAQTAARPTDESQDRFLKLLITQMQNQDPLNPMDNAQVTTQMAQISTVNGLGQINDSIAALMQQFAGMEAVQGAALAGRTVMVSGNGIELSGGLAAGGFELATPADSVAITVYNAAGEAVRRDNLGATPAGIRGFAWDGLDNAGNPAPEGRYTFRVQTLTAGTAGEAQTLAVATVGGVSRGDNGLELDLGAIGTRALSDVRRIQ